MDELEILRFWYEYNADLRPKYLDAISRLPPRTYFRNEGASYPLFQIYLHVLDAYRWWFRYVYRDEVRRYLSGRLRTRIRTIAGARRATQQTTREVLRFVRQLRSGDLNRKVEYSVPKDEDWSEWVRERVTLRVMLWHMVEEELQHRGEMNALLWRHGIEPPVIGIQEWRGHKLLEG